jgi:hypothetical protein
MTDGNLLSDEMKINLHMLHALILNGVAGVVHDANVVAVDTRVQRDGGAWSSCKSWRNQVTSATPLATTRYSASALERKTTVCRLADQETRLSPRSGSEIEGLRF